jgi:predicted DNA-binding ArsR family transcriptional regulator
MQSTGGTTDMQADDRPSDWRADPPAAERRGSATALDRLSDPDSANLPGLRKANDRRSRSPTRPNGTLERAFAMTGLCAAAGTAAGAFLGAHGYGWAPVLGAASFLLLICALTGIRTQELVVQFQRGEVAMVYATALAGPRRTVFDRRGPRPGRMETLGVAIADMLDAFRMAILGKEKVRRYAADMQRAIEARSAHANALAATLGEDAHTIAAAATAARRAEVAISSGIEALWQHADSAAGTTGTMSEDARALADAVREVTSHIQHASSLAVTLADTAFAAQRGVTAVSDVAATLSQAADQVKAVLTRAEMLGINAGIEAARAGEQGRGFAVVAAEVKTLATTGHAALEGMLHAVRTLRHEAAAMHKTIEAMGDTVQAQNAVGQSLADAASYQIQSVTRVVQQVDAATAGIVALRDRARAVDVHDLSLSGGPAARRAVERLPDHAEAVAKILRDLPVFKDVEPAPQS